MKRVVVTGMGILSSLGKNLNECWNRLHIYKNAVQHISELDKYRGINARLASVITNFTTPEHYTRKTLRSMGPVSIMALYSAEQALTQAGLLNSEELTNGRTGIAYGSSFGSIAPISDFFGMLQNNEIGDFNSSTYIKIMPHTAAVNLSLYFKTTGRLIPTGTACTSGSLAIGYAYEQIKYGNQDVMIAGGAEEFSPTQIAVFDTLFATSTKNDTPELSPSPFDISRDGLVIGEGAVTLILEEYEHAKARGATILAEIIGFGTNTDI